MEYSLFEKIQERQNHLCNSTKIKKAAMWDVYRQNTIDGKY